MKTFGLNCIRVPAFTLTTDMLRFVHLIRTRVLSMAVFFIILLDITLEWEDNMNQRFLDVLLSNSTHAGPLTNFYSFVPLSY